MQALKRFLVLFLLLILSFSTHSKTVEVVTFDYPPLMGKNHISDSGVLVEIVAAAFKESGINVEVTYYPTKRAVSLVDEGKSLLMIGLLDYFSVVSQKNLTAFPLLMIDFDVFYLKSRFPSKFQFNSVQDLKPYYIGVLLNGSTDLYGRKVGLNVDGVPSLEQVFKKLETKRNEICIANDLAGLYEISTHFAGKEEQFGFYSEKPFLSLISMAIFNKNHPDYKELEPKFRIGHRLIMKNGKWLAIVKKYYGSRGIPESVLRLLNESLSIK